MNCIETNFWASGGRCRGNSANAIIKPEIAQDKRKIRTDGDNA
jgi:hypothetical protein